MNQMTSCEKETPDREEESILRSLNRLSELSSTALEYFHAEWTVKTNNFNLVSTDRLEMLLLSSNYWRINRFQPMLIHDIKLI